MAFIDPKVLNEHIRKRDGGKERQSHHFIRLRLSDMEYQDLAVRTGGAEIASFIRKAVRSWYSAEWPEVDAHFRRPILPHFPRPDKSGCRFVSFDLRSIREEQECDKKDLHEVRAATDHLTAAQYTPKPELYECPRLLREICEHWRMYWNADCNQMDVIRSILCYSVLGYSHGEEWPEVEPEGLEDMPEEMRPGKKAGGQRKRFKEWNWYTRTDREGKELSPVRLERVQPAAIGITERGIRGQMAYVQCSGTNGGGHLGCIANVDRLWYVFKVSPRGGRKSLSGRDPGLEGAFDTLEEALSALGTERTSFDRNVEWTARRLNGMLAARRQYRILRDRLPG